MRNYAKTLSAFLIFAAVSTVQAQQNGGGQGGPPGGGPGGGMGGGMGGDGGPPDPQQMQEMMDARIKKAMAATDETFATLQPLIDKVQQLEHETDTGPMMHNRPPHPEDQDNNGGGPGPGADEDHPMSETEAAVSALKKVLTDKSSDDGKIETAMKAVQDAEKKAKDDLADARKNLRGIVNLRQQAVLVAMGVLN